MTFYVPNTGAGLLVGTHQADLGFTLVHKPTCQFLPDRTVPFDGMVLTEGENKVRRDFRVGKITGCAFCDPQVLVEGLAPHERHAANLAANERVCGCGHKYVSHAYAEPHGCQMEERNDWDENVRCECRAFVAAEPAVTVTSEPMQAPNPGDIIAPGAFHPGPVRVRFPNDSVTMGTIDPDGRVTVTIPHHVFSQAGGEVVSD